MIEWKKKEVLPVPEARKISRDGKWELIPSDGRFIFRAAQAADKTNLACYGSGKNEDEAARECKESLENAILVYQQTINELNAIIAGSEQK